MGKPFVHRYLPNSAPGVREAMLKAIGVRDVEEIYEEIPAAIRFTGELNMPKQPASELEVAKRITSMLAKNRATDQMLSFMGAGCWSHYVPALCDEINARSEFLTAYAGEPYTDHGRYQAIFEYQSMMADLLEMDIVAGPMFDGPSSAGDAAIMASRVTERQELLVPGTVGPDRLTILKVYSDPWLTIKMVDYDPATGELDLADLRRKISAKTAAVYVENPTYFGTIESQCEAIGQIAHDHGALYITYVNPASLGIVAPPGQYGADIVCGEAQPLGIHMGFGGNCLGILASRDDEQLVSAMPPFIVGMTTSITGEKTFSWHTLFERTCYYARDKVKSFTGSSSWLWAITAAVYMALMGPEGMRQLGEANMQKTYYAMDRLSKIKGLKTPVFSAAHFNEFIVNFDATGKTVAQVNQTLLAQEILGGKDLTQQFPQFGQSALFCVTETHTKSDIDRLASALAQAIR